MCIAFHKLAHEISVSLTALPSPKSMFVFDKILTDQFFLPFTTPNPEIQSSGGSLCLVGSQGMAGEMGRGSEQPTQCLSTSRQSAVEDMNQKPQREVFLPGD